MKKSNIIFIASCASLLIYSCNGNNKVEEKANAVKDTISTGINNEMDKVDKEKDHHFIREASQDGMLEVEMGKLAKDRAMSKDVKSFAKMIVTQHEEANKELKKLAEAQGVQIPDSLEDNNKIKLKEFESVKGKDFDKKYITHMVEDHKKEVDKFQEKADKTKDAELKSWIEKTLPHLKHHLEEAQKIDSTINKSSAKK